MKTGGRALLLIIVGMANGGDPDYALYWSTGFSLLFLLVFPLASALATAVIARRYVGQNGFLWGLLGFFFSIVAIVIVAVIGSIKRQKDIAAAMLSPQQNVYVPIVQAPPPPPPPRECAWCGSLIPADLDVCPNCAGKSWQ